MSQNDVTKPLFLAKPRVTTPKVVNYIRELKMKDPGKSKVEKHLRLIKYANIFRQESLLGRSAIGYWLMGFVIRIMFLASVQYLES